MPFYAQNVFMCGLAAHYARLHLETIVPDERDEGLLDLHEYRQVLATSVDLPASCFRQQTVDLAGGMTNVLVDGLVSAAVSSQPSA